ncbi:ABC transporter permease [Chloroflexota bacterium]
MAHLEDAQGRSAREPDDAGLMSRSRPVKLPWERWLPPIILLLVLLVWEVGGRAGFISSLFFPAPTIIARSLMEMIASGALWIDLRATLSRLCLGLGIGGGLGLLLGLMMGWSQRLRIVVDPFVAAVHPIPKITILPLIMIVLGIGESSKIALVAIATFFPMLINTMAGVRQIRPIHFEVAQNYGASPHHVLTHVVLPGSLPLILTGARLALNTALVLTIAVELLTAQEGLGATVWLAWETLRTEELYAVLLVVAVMGISFNAGLQYLTRRWVPWRVER